jgi:hypothetical protein
MLTKPLVFFILCPSSFLGSFIRFVFGEAPHTGLKAAVALQ